MLHAPPRKRVPLYKRGVRWGGSRRIVLRTRVNLGYKSESAGFWFSFWFSSSTQLPNQPATPQLPRRTPLWALLHMREREQEDEPPHLPARLSHRLSNNTFPGALSTASSNQTCHQPPLPPRRFNAANKDASSTWREGATKRENTRRRTFVWTSRITGCRCCARRRVPVHHSCCSGHSGGPARRPPRAFGCRTHPQGGAKARRAFPGAPTDS